MTTSVVREDARCPARPPRVRESGPRPRPEGPGDGKEPAPNRRGDLVENELYDGLPNSSPTRATAAPPSKTSPTPWGHSRTALYYYVKNKEDLLAKLVAEVSQELAATLRAIRRQPG